MKLSILLAAILFLFSGGMAQTFENHIASRVLYFDQNGLTSQEAAQTHVAVPASVFSYTSEGVVSYGGSFYQTYNAQYDAPSDIYVIKSSDGINWSSPVEASDDIAMTSQFWPSMAVYGDPVNPRILVVWNDQRDGTNLSQVRIATSSDGGQTFSPSIAISAHSNAVITFADCDADDNGNLYVVWGYQTLSNFLNETWFSKSTDNGATWDVPKQIYSERQYSYPPAISARGNGELFVTVVADQFFKTNLVALHSTDGGANFATRPQITNYDGSNGNEGPYRTYSMIEDGANLHILYPFITNGELVSFGYSQSTDFGFSWSNPGIALDTTLLSYQNTVNLRNSVDIAISDQGILYAVRADLHQDPAQLNYDVYLSRSADDGQTWEEIMIVNEMPDIEEQAYAQLSVKSSGTLDTVLVTWLEQRVVSGIEDELSGLADNFKLKQNYPNPFNPSTTIAYSLNRAASVSIAVYDNSGRRVANLEQGMQPAGSYTTPFVAEELASGVYHYSLEIDGVSVQSCKMVLIK
ncbi:MAG: T9SS type A sorting domain-containing protein [Calditrichia bacterium]